MTSVSGLRPHVLAAKQRLAQGREKLKLRHQQGSPGVQVCGALTELLDKVVLELYHAAQADLGESDPEGLPAQIALVAHAGYGRRDVAPYSDVDLMILHSREAADRVVPLANRLVRDVFDAGLILGQSVRTPEQALELSLADPVICTSLVESRLLTGSQSLFDKFFQRFKNLVHRKRSSLLPAMEKARRDERSQYGETVYLLEPNIKRSSGALRDIQLLRWVGFAVYGIGDPDGLQLCGAISKDDQRVLRHAAEFLLRLRNEIHFHSGSAHDVLDRAEQVRIAKVFAYEGQEGLLPVEQFMREYFRRTSEVSRLAARFIDTAQPGSRAAWLVELAFSHQVERDFRVGPTQITPTRRGLAKLRRSLTEILRLADLANLADKRLSRSACDAIRETVPSLNSDVGPEAAERFLSIMSHTRRLGEILRLLHDLGVLEKVIPEFEHARCLLQFNEYHKYTVDEHSFRAVEKACSLLHDPGPLGRVCRHIKQKRLLHLALLIHDLGKGYPVDHSDLGLMIAERTGGRLGLSPSETDALKLLVHKHLVMSHLAFRRDTSDEQIIVKFAVEVGSPDMLEILYVLTACDLAAVGPGVLNDWKIEVLTDLFHRTMRHLAGDSPTSAPDDRWKQKQEEIFTALGKTDDPNWYAEQVRSLPPAYLHTKPLTQIAADLKELHRLKPGEVIARGRFLPDSRTVEYAVFTHEDITAGVFHKLTGALAGKGLRILSADINTLAHRMVLDRFFVHDPDCPDEPPADRVNDVCQSLVQSLHDDGAPSFRRIWRPGRGAAAIELPPLPTQVRIDNSTSERFTILDIFAADRLGLLYTISRTLFELGLSVSVAKIGTYLDQVVDVFYVTDQHGRKVEEESRLREIRTRLLDAIATIERNEREGVAVS